MRKTIAALLLLCNAYTQAQTICGIANEGGTVTLTAPSGFVINSITFASYGTPNGTCGGFTLGGCHASNSASIVEAAFLGQNSASINATNAVFGDPCGGTVKRLYIQATYASALPLTLNEFLLTAMTNGQVRLQWTTTDEYNTSYFEPQFSNDARQFVSLPQVTAKGSGAGTYSAEHKDAPPSSVLFYRLKMVDKDGSSSYSSIKAIKTSATAASFKAVQFGSQLVITSPIIQDAQLINSNGQLVKVMRLQYGATQLDIASLSQGVYILKTATTSLRFVKQ